MSIKIFNAYRLRKGLDLARFMHMVQYTASQNVESTLRNEHHHWMQAVDPNSAKYKAVAENRASLNDPSRGYTPKQVDQLISNDVAGEMIQSAYKESDRTQRRSPFNYDASVTFRELDGYWYMQVFADWTMGKVFDFATSYAGVRDYHYQTASDKPATVTVRDWRKRRKVWDSLYEDRPFGRKDCLSLVVMNIDEFSYWQWPHVAAVADKIRKGIFRL